MSAPTRVAWLAVLLAACSSPSHDSADAAVDAAIVGCGAPTGDFHDQVLAKGDGIEDRYYWMHVPTTYSCAAPMPLLVDVHGTASDMPCISARPRRRDDRVDRG